MQEAENLEKAGIWRNGSGVRYASSSRSSQRFDSPLGTPISRAGEREEDTLQKNNNITLPSLIVSPDSSQVQRLLKTPVLNLDHYFLFQYQQITGY